MLQTNKTGAAGIGDRTSCDNTFQYKSDKGGKVQILSDI